MSDIDQTLAEEALRIVTGARREKYDRPERNFERIALVWQALTDRPYTAHEVALMFVGLKIVRDAYSPQRDNKVDGIGYLLCADAVEFKAPDFDTILPVGTPGTHTDVAAKEYAEYQAARQAKAAADYAKSQEDMHINCKCPLSMPAVDHSSPSHDASACYACIYL